MTYTFTSESVAIGHPDKVADQISDHILDACLAQDPLSRVAVETLITSDLVVLAGEVTTSAKVDYDEIARETIRNIGYDSKEKGFDPDKAKVLVKIHSQSPDIAQGIGDEGAGDQGLMFGFATKETPCLMPMPIDIAQSLMRGLVPFRKEALFLRPDGKSQVTVAYESGKPAYVESVVLSVQHDEKISVEELRHLLTPYIKSFIPFEKEPRLIINPTGRFVIGGPQGDTGLTGRKIIVDTYGAFARHGGGAFSGKDPTKVDRSAAYMARYLAKQIVGSGRANTCEIQIAYAIGLKEPVALRVNTFGDADDRKLEEMIRANFDLSPRGIIAYLDLRRPIYQKTAFGGHFGRHDVPWEKLDRTDLLTKVML